MIIDSWDYYTSFRLCDPHYLKCPTCEQGGLKFNESQFVTEETLQSRKARNKKSFKDWDAEFTVNTHLACSREECGERVSFSGVISYGKPIKGGSKREYITPLFFFPVVHLFPIPYDCPYEVSEELKKAFGLYWIDSTSCVNKIRTCVEYILIDQGITGKKVSLHNRIMLYSKKYEKQLAESITTRASKQPAQLSKREAASLNRRVDSYTHKDKRNKEISKALLAVKWIGNAGSHADEYELDIEEVVVGLKLLQSIINDLYSDHEFNLKATRDYINKTGRPSPFLY